MGFPAQWWLVAGLGSLAAGLPAVLAARLLRRLATAEASQAPGLTDRLRACEPWLLTPAWLAAGLLLALASAGAAGTNPTTALLAAGRAALLPLATALVLRSWVQARSLPALAAAERRAQAGLHDSARALAMAGKYVEEAVTPFREAVNQLGQTVGRLDPTVMADRLAHAASTFEAKLSDGAAQMALAAGELGSRAAEVSDAAARLDDAADRILGAFSSVESGLDRLAGALAPLETAATALSAGSAALTTAHEQTASHGQRLAELTAAWQADQRPLLEALGRTGGALQETAGNLDHLLVQLHANQDSIATNLEAVYQRLNGAAGRLEQAVGTWGDLVRSGLASTQEFSRQAVEALLDGLEQSPPDFAAVADSARRTAEAATAMSQAVTTSLGGFQAGIRESSNKLAQLTLAIDQRVQHAVAPLAGGEIEKLGQHLAGLQQTVAQLGEAVGAMQRSTAAGSGFGALAEELRLLREALRAPADQDSQHGGARRWFGRG
ncbi:MAG: hypothetical protein IT204_09195 [Fimbriimonadaceae bacterium]|nr:hypothetical protein [Fimbriimonadaceae bacterium]